MANKTSESQLAANKRYNAANKDVVRRNSDKSAARRSIRRAKNENDAEFLNELKKLLNEDPNACND
ncbi:MAG: hypothetical protein ABF709_04965 [Leuconostoc pseudomesenteroides]|uniref:hypothetical protein n=1 Tax=Leuconostoc pseudomesenteroides TaxID=33968 RepID=UPI001E512508|nr:hypothetical protein [Leuconostoc pseudomesenteroides]MCC7668931.1 hypothetical protein [Leuconostoc pseudomesenteroides]